MFQQINELLLHLLRLYGFYSIPISRWEDAEYGVVEINVVNGAILVQSQSFENSLDIRKLHVWAVQIWIQKSQQLLLVDAVTALAINETKCFDDTFAVFGSSLFDRFKLTVKAQLVVQNLTQAKVNLGVKLDHELPITAELALIIIFLIVFMDHTSVELSFFQVDIEPFSSLKGPLTQFESLIR